MATKPSNSGNSGSGLKKRIRPAIASVRAEALFKNGRRRKVLLSVTAPWKEDGSWWVQPKIHGLGLSLMPVAGYDSMQALTLSLTYAICRMEFLEKELKFQLVWPGERMRYNLREIISGSFSKGRKFRKPNRS